MHRNLTGQNVVFVQVYLLRRYWLHGGEYCPVRNGYQMCIRDRTKYLHLIIQMDMLLKELRIVLSSHCDLAVSYTHLNINEVKNILLANNIEVVVHLVSTLIPGSTYDDYINELSLIHIFAFKDIQTYVRFLSKQ